MQQTIFNKARDYRDAHITEVNDFDTFKEVLKNKGGFIAAHWDGTAETEQKIKELTKATIRCIPLAGKEEQGTCVLTGKPSLRRVLFAKAY
jgi:prolyl-tRNA synthetase